MRNAEKLFYSPIAASFEVQAMKSQTVRFGVLDACAAQLVGTFLCTADHDGLVWSNGVPLLTVIDAALEESMNVAAQYVEVEQLTLRDDILGVISDPEMFLGGERRVGGAADEMEVVSSWVWSAAQFVRRGTDARSIVGLVHRLEPQALMQRVRELYRIAAQLGIVGRSTVYIRTMLQVIAVFLQSSAGAGEFALVSMGKLGKYLQRLERKGEQFSRESLIGMKFLHDALPCEVL